MVNGILEKATNSTKNEREVKEFESASGQIVKINREHTDFSFEHLHVYCSLSFDNSQLI